MIGTVYKILDLNSLKCYIGSTVNFEKRKKHHLKQLNDKKHHSKHLQNVYNKYGEENFQFVIIETNILTKEDLIEREQYWLDLLQPFKSNGFNTCKKAYSVLGVRFSKEVNLKKGVKGRVKVIQYSKEGNLIKIWESISEASRILQCDTSSICSGIKYNKIAVGFVWKKYTDNYSSNILKYVPPKRKTPTNQSMWLASKVSYTINNITKIVETQKEFLKDINIPHWKFHLNKEKFIKQYNIKYL